MLVKFDIYQYFNGHASGDSEKRKVNSITRDWPAVPREGEKLKLSGMQFEEEVDKVSYDDCGSPVVDVVLTWPGTK